LQAVEERVIVLTSAVAASEEKGKEGIVDVSRAGGDEEGGREGGKEGGRKGSHDGRKASRAD
jgi:hypothetical protein